MPFRQPKDRPTQADLAEAVVAEGVSDRLVIEAFRRVPRASFVPPGLVHRAYLDLPLPIPREQVTTQPSLVAKLVEALGLRGCERVLEIGTGYGFQTALLACIASFVWSIERWPDIAETAHENLARAQIKNAAIVVGDGTEGLAEQAPFDAILVSAAFPSVVGPLADQLAQDGRIVQPIGYGGAEEVALFIKRPHGLVRRRTVTQAHFVRLYGKHGFHP